MFESLWIDKPDAEHRIAALQADDHTSLLGGRLSNFYNDGFVIIPQAVDPIAIDRYIEEFKRLVQSGKLKADAGVLKDANAIDMLRPGTKILDVHFYSAISHQLIFSDAIKTFLENIFEEQPLAFQTLHFEAGSTQGVHNDTAYVVLNEPKSLAASWIALEDIEEGSGELIYYPGSHRFDDFLYKPYRKHFVHETASKKGLALQSFRPRKGDALIWHADLAHGGGPITRPNATRRSLVTHYCPARCTPHYFRYMNVEHQLKVKSPAGGYTSSAYYRFDEQQDGSRRLSSGVARRDRVYAAMRRMFRKTSATAN